ncbi:MULTISPECIES: RNA polymerase sigma factor [unclassified Epibacterium]|jgi:RNA polymerase sigma-70 factor (ECF subfamily)|uniref:RNA polymerase sigma factor n=1 Tax=unclassified Epibacterium TaxID=2639179 RepID=UPI001EF602A4|nr:MULTISPECIES: RNA polymerase sigma factor [unclassified Epibacterium]MCG7621792.1 RNA polymerase sigma factor [Epibacterium sp. Ofav1-8]MCG7627219.1 RNA polymerase sigma factor [Epibacterium sp. MM17-32]
MDRQNAKAELTSHMKVLRAFAMSLTRNDAAADDLVQDTVLKAWSNFDKFQEGTNMRAWLFTILRNTFYSNRRKAAREVEDSTGTITESISVKPAHDGRLQLAEFRVALAELPAEQREVLTLIGVLQYSYEEAAEVCGVKVGTIKSRLNRGREALASSMQINIDDQMELTDAATHAVVAASGGTAA